MVVRQKWADLVVRQEPAQELLRDIGLEQPVPVLRKHQQREYVSEKLQKKIVVNEAYLARQAPVVRERLKMAAVRLAAILNPVFADAVVANTKPELTPATSEDIHRLSKRIECLEQAIRALTEELSRRRLDGAQSER